MPLEAWCSGLTCSPVKAETAGSNPVASAKSRTAQPGGPSALPDHVCDSVCVGDSTNADADSLAESPVAPSQATWGPSGINSLGGLSNRRVPGRYCPSLQ